MTHTPELVISIINYRTGPMTIQCIESVMTDIGEIDAHVVVVDNASGDGSDELIADWIATADTPIPVTLVRSELNTGFSGGHNQGISAIEGQFYLLLNSDAVVSKGFFNALITAGRSAPKQVGLIAPRLAGPDGETQISCFRFPTVISEFSRAICTGFVSRILREHEVAIGTDPKPEEIEWASFASILIRGDMIQDIGLMDEGYFLYFEDAEYCLRARRAGWTFGYAPEATTIHFRGGSGPVKALAASKKRMPRYYYLSRTRFFYQAHGRMGLLGANAAWYFGRALAQFRRLAGQIVHPMCEREASDIWIGASAPLAESGGPTDQR
ncbi:MAG: glycosyltransferase family 2 protein [Pseudomonadota bacterium]